MSTEDTQLDKELNRLYELAFHVVPTDGESGAEKAFDTIKNILEKECKVVSESKPSLINLLYPMIKPIDSRNHKHNTGYFAWIKFEAESDAIESINKEIEVMDSILRFMIIKSEKDTNIKTEEIAKFLSGDKEEPKKKVKKEDQTEDKEEIDKKEELNKEADTKEVDKAIDELVEVK